MQDMESLYISGHFARAIAFCCPPVPYSLSVFLSAYEIIATTTGSYRSTAVKVATIDHPAVVAEASAQLPGMRKFLRFDRAHVLFFLLFASGNAPSSQRAHSCVPASPRNVAPKRQPNHDMASVVVSDFCSFAIL